MAVADLEPIPMQVDDGAAPARSGRSSVQTLAIAVVVALALGLTANQVRLESRIRDLDAQVSDSVSSETFNELDATVSSLKARSVRVPNLVGRTVTEALDLLGVAGLEAGTMAPSVALDVPEQCVVWTQAPEAGATLQPGKAVNLQVGAPPGDSVLNCL
jgi:hypothetical protein